MRNLYLLALALLLGLTGCSQCEPAMRNDVVQYYGTPRAYAYEIRLSDGTRCVTYSDSIVCDWKTAQPE